jgi:hypothetical protein
MAKIAALLDKNCPTDENCIFTSIFSLLGQSFWGVFKAVRGSVLTTST